jgi:hypothetical protein
MYGRMEKLYYDKGFLQKMQYKFGRYAIKNLMMYIVGAMAVVFASGFLLPINIVSVLAFDIGAIMQGEVWRIITFIVIPPNASIIFIIFALYFYWLIGSTLEQQWGAFKFNVFYLCGIISTIIAGLIVGYATNFYLNLSLFLAFALLFPNFEVRLFFVLPIKMKWLAYASMAYLVYLFIFNSWSEKAVLLVSIVNIILFFGKGFVDSIKQKRRKAQWKRNMR